MRPLNTTLLAGLICAGFVGGCQSAPNATIAPLAPAPALGPAPQACLAGFSASAATLDLPPPLPPKDTGTGKSGRPLQFAVSLPANQALSDLDAWRTSTDGWAVLRLRVRSPNATSLALRFTQVQLPAEARVWLCGAGGALAQQATQGELLTPRASGEEVWMEIFTPAHAVGETRMVLTEAFAGFR